MMAQLKVIQNDQAKDNPSGGGGGGGGTLGVTEELQHLLKHHNETFLW